jgi:GNAT superfamily N-acetyltransferase
MHLVPETNTLMSMNRLKDIQIRPAQLGDAAGIARVRVTSWRATYQGIVPQEVLDGLSVKDITGWMERMIASPAPGSCHLVAQAQSRQIVGFAMGGPERTQDPNYEGELYAIYILPDFLRIGIGRQLLLSIAGCLLGHGMHSMLIWVLAENPARQFYEALGGVYVRQQTITLGSAPLPEVAYGWQDLNALLQAPGPNPPAN